MLLRVVRLGFLVSLSCTGDDLNKEFSSNGTEISRSSWFCVLVSFFVCLLGSFLGVKGES